jgi:trk system potassium uptake protein TrkH
MNYKKLGNILGKIMIMEGVLMTTPLIVSFIYREDLRHKLGFLVSIAILALFGGLLQIPRPKRNTLYQKEGFALTALVWILMTVFGALPFVINGDIPNYVDACFEMMSGFTTTGASIITDISKVSHSTSFWRCLSHWVGGMGVLVFVLIFIPESNDGSSMHLLRAESPGPQVGKIVSKMKMTTRILYLIYLGMTVIVAILLLCDKPIVGYEQDHVYISIVTALGCAGTGGFGVIPGSMELFNPFSQYVVAIALIFFGINFGLYYLILIGQIKSVFRSEELKSYFFIVITAIGLCFLSLIGYFGKFPQTYTTEEAFRHSLFQVASLLTTAGYSTTDFNLWPILGRTALIVVMFIGGMAGSTAGGIKVSRIVMSLKGAYIDVRKLINPRYVPKAKFEGKTLERSVINDVFAFITFYFFILILVTLLMAFDPINGSITTIISDAGTYTVEHGFFSNFSATLSCMSNIGPAFEAIGPYASFASYSMCSKIILTFTMLLGRLEILPVLILFNKRTWTRI